MKLGNLTKAEGGRLMCNEYAVSTHASMVDKQSVKTSALAICLRYLARGGLIEVERGFWCTGSYLGKVAYEVCEWGLGDISTYVRIVDSAKFKRNKCVEWRRVKEGCLEECPPYGSLSLRTQGGEGFRMAKKKRNTESSGRVYFDLALWRMTEIARSVESIERKLASTIALIGVVVVLFVGSVAFGFRPSGEGTADPISGPEAIVVAAAVISFALAVFFAFLGYRTKSWKAGPLLSDLGKLTNEYGESDLLNWAGEALQRSEESNEEMLGAMAQHANLSLFFSLASLVFIVLFALVLRIPW